MSHVAKSNQDGGIVPVIKALLRWIIGIVLVIMGLVGFASGFIWVGISSFLLALFAFPWTSIFLKSFVEKIFKIDSNTVLIGVVILFFLSPILTGMSIFFESGRV